MSRPFQLHLQVLEPREVPALAFFSAVGNTAADITDTVNQYRSVLGTQNANVSGSFGSGRREINWDGVPAAKAAPNNLPADFFNTTSPRGVVLSTPGSGFQVSGNTADAGTGQPAIEFENFNSTYPTLFAPFSAQRLFTPVGSNTTDVTFFVPGTTTPATVNAFGVIFSDVDASANFTNLEFFDASGNSLGFQGAPSIFGNETFSFVGGFDPNGKSIARVRIKSGNRVIGGSEGGSNDVVVMDDFIYGEPVAAPAPPTVGDIPNQTVAFGSTVGPVAFTVNDLNTPSGQLALSATSSNPALVADGGITFGGSGANRTVIVNSTAGQSGTATITVTVTDADGQTATDTFDVTVAPPVIVPAPTPSTVDLFAVATGAGVPVQVNVFEADGTLRFHLTPFDGFTGGATVATGDVTGDGVDDIAVAAGPGAGPHVKVFDGVSGAEIRSFFAYDSGFAGGVFIGLGDLTGDGRADIVTGAGPGAGPHVKVFDGVGGAEIRSFFAFDETFQGGVSVRAGDIDGDGFADIIVGAGPGGGPHVKVFSGQNQNELDSVLVGDPAFTGGVLVGAGNFAFDFRSEVVVSTNGRLSVIGYEKAGAKLTRYVEQDNIVPFGEGIDAAPASIRLGNGNTAILVGAVGQSATRVMIIDRTSNSVRSFSAFEGLVFAGVNVG